MPNCTETGHNVHPPVLSQVWRPLVAPKFQAQFREDWLFSHCESPSRDLESADLCDSYGETPPHLVGDRWECALRLPEAGSKKREPSGAPADKTRARRLHDTFR